MTAGTVYIDTADPYVYDGQNSLNLTLANLYAPNTVSQSLATVIGQLYSVSFWGNADSPNSFSLLENGMGLNGAPSSIANNGFPGAVSNSSLFQNYTATFTANAASTLLSFTDTGNPAINSSNGSVEIDDVSAQAVTPEPESLVFVLTGAVGLGGVLRRRWMERSAC